MDPLQVQLFLGSDQPAIECQCLNNGRLGINPLARLTRKLETDRLLVAGDEITEGGPGDCGSSALRRRTVAGVAEALQGTDIYFQRRGLPTGNNYRRKAERSGTGFGRSISRNFGE